MGYGRRAILAACMAAVAQGARAEAPEDLSGLTLEQLGEVQVTSVSKHAEAISEAASSVFVIRHEDIVSSGARTLPEILRLAPNLEVEQVSGPSLTASTRAICCRR